MGTDYIADHMYRDPYLGISDARRGFAVRKTCLRMVYELAKEDERIVFIGSDLGAGVMEDFKREMPDRFFMEGIAEQNMVAMATGMALSGHIVYVHTIATFLTRRAFEFVCLGPGLHNANVRLIGAGGSGSTYAPLGPTHQAIDDIALMRTIPNMTILAPCDAVEMERMMPDTVNHQGPIYIRLGRGGDPILPPPLKNSTFRRALIITTGTTAQLGHEAAVKLGAMHLYLRTVKPLDRATILELKKRKVAIVTVEDHGITGGLGSAVAELLAETGRRHFRFKRIGYPDVFPHGYGSQDELRARYGITVDGIMRTVKELCGQDTNTVVPD